MASENDPTTTFDAFASDVADQAPAEQSTAEHATAEHASADQVAAEVAPPEKPKRRRATKKAAAPAAEPAASADEAPGASDGEEVAPAKKVTRKRAAKKATANTPAKRAKKVPEPVEEPVAPSVVETAEEPVSEPTDEVLEDAVEDDTLESVEADVAEQAPAAVPSFGLLFQAPEPVAPRRRRATAPAQAPAERVVEDEPATRAGGDVDDAGPDPRPADAEAPGARGARRSRGGRTGRGARTDRSLTTDAAEDTDTGDATDTAEVGATTDPADEPGGAEGGRGSDERASDDLETGGRGSRRRRGGRGRRGRSLADEDQAGTASEVTPARGAQAGGTGPDDSGDDTDSDAGSTRRRRRRRRGAGSGEGEGEDPPGTVTRVREPRAPRDEPTAVKGSTRLEAKKQRRREGREAGRRRTIITEAEFLARRESVERVMVVRGRGDRTQIGVLEDGVLVEHYVSRETTASMAGNVYLGRVQNVLPSMEAAFVDIGKGRNAVLYAGEVNWDAAGLEGGQARRIENALSSGDTVLVQVTKDPIGHKGARLTSQISLPGRYLVYVPEGQMTGISRKLPDTERARLKSILKEVVPDSAGVIVRTAAEGASEEELRADVERLTTIWDKIKARSEAAGAKKAGSGGAPALLHGEPDLTVRVIRDVFTEDFTSLVVSGDKAWSEVSQYVEDVAPDLAPRLQRWTSENDVFAAHRIDESLAKAMDRKVWLPSGGSLVIDRTEAMTVVDVNTGKFIGSGGNLEETVTKNNLEAAEEIVRQLRLRDIGGIIVVDFIDMVLESNRDLVVRRLLECLGRDRTKHQVAEVTSLGLVQMTRKRVGSGLVEVFSEQCEHCGGRGIIVQSEPVDRGGASDQGGQSSQGASRSARGRRGTAATGSSGSGSNGSGAGASGSNGAGHDHGPATEGRTPSGPTAAQIAAAAHAAALRRTEAGADVAPAAPEAGAAADVSVVPEAVVPEAVEPAAVEADAVVPDAVEADAVVRGAVEASAVVPDAVATPEQPSVPPAPEEYAAPEAAAAPRGRRKRARVVAPAGPPRGADAGSNPPAPGPA